MNCRYFLQGAGGLPDLVVLPLRHLKLRGCRHLSDIGFGAVGKLRDLQLLDLGDCPQFTDMAAMGDANFVSMTCRGRTGDKFDPPPPRTTAELRHLAALTDLDVSGCIQLTNGALSGLTSCRALTRLRAAGCPHLTDTGLAPVVASAFASLTSLDVSGLHRLQGASLSPLMSASRLRTLRLEGCCSLQDFHLRALLPFPSLASLSLAGSTALTDASLAALTALESLSDLSLSRCPQARPLPSSPLARSAAFSCLGRP